MRLLAISDLHLSKLVSLDPVKKIANHLNDWLILAGDIAENTEFFSASLEFLRVSLLNLFGFLVITSSGRSLLGALK